MKIVADDNMPLVRELFSPYGEVVTCPGRELTAAHLVDADVLLVRSVTPVNAALLEGSPIQFVGSATIGVDHVDMDYLTSRNIRALGTVSSATRLAQRNGGHCRLR